jgi:hypothetical protein
MPAKAERTFVGPKGRETNSAEDMLKPGGVLALIMSHFTLDKQNAALRE